MFNGIRLKQRIKSRLLSKARVVEISKCVHYCGFRYGQNEYNPYETYIIGLHEGKNEEALKEQFIDFLRYYRPTSFGEALGVDLSKKYPLWQYPWSSFIDPGYNAYDMSPERIPDIITHFSAKGIPFKIIENEFSALKSAYQSISLNGYLPRKYGYAEVLVLKNKEANAYILLDGNHRASALSALGYKNMETRIFIGNIVDRSDVKNWPGVKSSFFTEDDALHIFDVYFEGNHHYRTTDTPAPVIY